MEKEEFNKELERQILRKGKQKRNGLYKITILFNPESKAMWYE